MTAFSTYEIARAPVQLSSLTTTFSCASASGATSASVATATSRNSRIRFIGSSYSKRDRRAATVMNGSSDIEATIFATIENERLSFADMNLVDLADDARVSPPGVERNYMPLQMGHHPLNAGHPLGPRGERPHKCLPRFLR